MIVRKNLDWRIVLRMSWKRMAAVAFLCLLVKLAQVSPGEPLVMAVGQIEGILGTAVSILIGFRVNAAYDRWWEGHRIWGSLVSESRTFARQVLSLLSLHFHPERDGETIDGSRRELVLGQVGLAFALKNHLRQMPEAQQTELVPFFPPEARAELLASRHVPGAILLWQARRLQVAFEERHTEDFRHMQIDATLTRLNELVAGADRLKFTVFPRQYTVYSTVFTAMFANLLPLALMPVGGWPAMPFVLAVGFIFFAMDSISGAIVNPFENSLNDVPMSALARNIEIQLREALGETDLPPTVQPVNGFLM